MAGARRSAFVLMAAVLFAGAAQAATIMAPPRGEDPPYPVADVLPCLEHGERDLCLMRMFVRDKGEPWLRQWFEVYADPEFAASIGIDAESPPAPARFAPSSEDGLSEEVLRQVLSLDRRGAPPDQALQPFDRLVTVHGAARYHGGEASQLLVLVEMAHDPAFPSRRRPSAALARAAEARLRAALADTPAILRQHDAEPYFKLLIRLGDKAGAEEVDALAWRGYSERPSNDEIHRIERLARLGHLDEAAAAAGAMKRDLSMDSSDDFAIVQLREMVAWEAERQGRKDLALVLERRILDEACSDGFQIHAPVFEFTDAMPAILRLAGPQEAAQWTERVEARSRASANEDARLEAALAAFRAWRALGRPERAHRILDAWTSQSGRGSAEYDFEPKGMVASMLLYEGRVDEAWALAPDAKILIHLDREGSTNLDRIIAKVPAGQRFAALADCVEARPVTEDADLCMARLEAEARSPSEKLRAANALLDSLWPDTSDDYGPFAYGVPPPRAVLEARFRMAARLLRAAAAADPTVLAAPMDAVMVRQATRLSLDAALIDARRAAASPRP
jgi:hypothetical protein